MTARAKIRSSQPSGLMRWMTKGWLSRSASTMRSRPVRETPVTFAL